MRFLRQSRADLLKAAETREIIIAGGGAMALRLLNTIDIAGRVRFICENTQSRIGSSLCGIPIVDMRELEKVSPQETVVVVASRDAQEELAKQVRDVGDFDIYFARVLVSETFETVACELFDHLNQIEKASSLLADDTSRRIYKETITRRMLYGETDFSDLIIDGDAEYLFPQMFAEKAPSDEVIVDCGAYTGDTVALFCREFGRKVKKIWALECGHTQLEELREHVERLKRLPYCPQIEILPYAVSDHEQTLDFYQTAVENGSFVAENRSFAKNDKYDSKIYQVKSAPLDSLLPKDEMVTMIKMDIEGSEFQALRGGAELIRRCRPKLAVSIYHSGIDYFRLIMYIKELVPEYKIAVRHHKKSHVDTDLYAWV